MNYVLLGRSSTTFSLLARSRMASGAAHPAMVRAQERASWLVVLPGNSRLT